MASVITTITKRPVIGTFLLLSFFTFCHTQKASSTPPSDSQEQLEGQQEDLERLTIGSIIIDGLESLPEDTILSKVPYHVGETFDPKRSNSCIRQIYDLGYFRNITLSLKKASATTSTLYITLEEKTPLKEVVFKGNKNLKEKDILKKIAFDKVAAIEQEDLKKYIKSLQELYAEKGFHFVEIKGDIEEKDGKAIVTFTIKEGIQAHVQKVRFKGNTSFNGKVLRSLLFTRENWIFGFLDKSGFYMPLAVEQDRLTIENFYQSNGYLEAKVTDTLVQFDKAKRNITITFVIEEGDKYTISSVSAPGNDVLNEDQLKGTVPVREGQLYSKELLRVAIERLRLAWGQHGYIYADIQPAIEPNKEEKTVAVTFYSEPGNKIFLNKINIAGNEKTKDKVVRRQMVVEEGDMLTTAGLEISKNKINQLGYFDLKEGVNWKLTRINDETADIDMFLKEIKTGRFEFRANYGGTPGKIESTASGLSVQLTALERNLFGSGIYAELMGRMGSDEMLYNLSILQPWFCDRPIYLGCDNYYSSSVYEEIKKVTTPIDERRMGGSVKTGFMWQGKIDTAVRFSAGFEVLHNTRPVADISGNTEAQIQYQAILTERFRTSKFFYVENKLEQDTRNHNLHITDGHYYSLTNKIGFPALGENVAFYKIDADLHWYTPIIGQNSLVLHLHGYLGIVTPLGNNRIPFRDLYNIGGQASVRAWKFGQIGPMFTVTEAQNESWLGEPIGAQKAFFCNVELIFPLTDDFTYKGVLFYDGGAGWDTPSKGVISPEYLVNNSFDFRQCIGVGLKLLKPQPMRVDWGFKLDRRTGETSSEVNFSTYYDF